MRFLQPYTAGLATEKAAAAQLRALIGGKKLLMADLARIERAAQAWRAGYAAPSISQARRGALTGNDLTLLDQGKNAFDRLRVLFAAQNAHLSAATLADRAALGRARVFQNWVYVAILVVFLLAAAALAVLLDRTVIRPLHRLRAASDEVAGGDYSHHIQPAGPADLWALSAAVEGMRSELVAALEASRAAQAVAARQRPTWMPRPPSCAGPTPSWSSSPTWPRTICRNRCARSPRSASCWRSATATNSTSGA